MRVKIIHPILIIYEHEKRAQSNTVNSQLFIYKEMEIIYELSPKKIYFTLIPNLHHSSRHISKVTLRGICKYGS
jgi:hypothetical protein